MVDGCLDVADGNWARGECGVHNQNGDLKRAELSFLLSARGYTLSPRILGPLFYPFFHRS